MGNKISTYYGFFKEEEVKELASLYNKGGFEAVVSRIKEKSEALENETLKIAVTGASGVGKSALINAMRGLSGSDPGAAEEGSTEQTMVVTDYPHPQHPTLCFYDLPGVGTTKFSSTTYVKKLELCKYDVFIIVLGVSVMENDVFLARKINEMGKKIYFLRSKIDIEMDNLEKQNRQQDKERELNKIRQYCIQKLEEIKFPSQEVFLVSSYRMNDFDFSRFCNVVVSDLSENKRHVFNLALPNFSTDVIETKKASLHQKILGAAALSGVAGASPIPGTSLLCDIGILVTTFMYIRSSFGLDDESLQRLAWKFGKPVEVLKAEVKNPFISDISAASVLKLITTSVAGAVMAAEEAAHFIPIVGSVVGPPLSFLSTYSILTNSLDEFGKSAVRVIIKTTKK
ncbi:interferon-inducible GTPase 5-like isoform X1 [Polypterus senegalus]